MNQVEFDNEGFALKSGYILVHICDQNNIYSHSEEQFVSVGCGLAANAVLEPPLPTKQGFAVQRVGNKWQYVVDNRGKTVYSITDKTPLTITEIGVIPAGYTEIEPTHPYSEWNGQGWIISPVQQAVKRTEDIAKVREAINRKRDETCFGGIYIETLGKWFDTDETSFVKMIGAKAVMDDDFAKGQEVQPELWICADNSVVQLNRDDFALIIRSVKQNVSNMHAVAVQHKMELEQSEKPSEYDFSAGWSKTYAEYVNEQKS